MEGFQMKRFFRTKLPAVLLALTLMVSMIPMAGAAVTWTGGKADCPHTSTTLSVYWEPTCSKTGMRVYTCDTCGAVGVENVATLPHTFYNYTYNDTYHWRVCSKCGAEDPTSRGTHVDANRDGRCDVCSMTMRSSSSGSAGDITYQVSPGGRVNLDEDDFYAFFNKYASSGTLRYVEFDRPDSSAFSEGTLYYDYGGRDETSFTRSSLASGTFYYDSSYDGKNEEYDLDNLTFVAGRDFEDDVTLSFRAYYSSSRYVDGTVTITTGKSSSTTSNNKVVYEVAAGGRINLDEDDFYKFFDKNSSSGSLRYVEFDRPDSSAFSEGTLYYDYGGKNEKILTRSNLNSYTFYYDGSYNEYYGEYDLDDLTFVADKDFEDDVTLTFRAYYNSSRYVDGTLVITAGKSSSAKADLTYEVAAGSRVNLDEDDFYDFFDKNSSSGSLRYVVFDRPDSSAFSEGTLYYDYGGKNEKILTRSNLSSYTFYYDGSYDEYYEEYDLDDLTFVADKDFEDDVTLTFRAYYNSSRYVDGKLTITTGKSSSAKADFTYEVEAGGRVNLDEDDFYKFFDKNSTGSLRDVVFDRPDSSAFAQGTLYSDYGG